MHVIMRAKHESFCVARALSRRAAFSFHVDTSIFSRDKTVLTMGKPEVNPTFHWKTLVPPGGTNSSVGGTNSNTNGIKRKYPPHLSLIPTSLIISTNFINHWYQMYIYY